MTTPLKIAQEIVAREGGYVNDPDDPGGATKYGVTIHTLRNLGMDLDRDGDIDVADVRLLTHDDAVAIFLDHYFTRPKIHLLPEPLQASVFDMYVNAGSNAVRILQRLLAEFQEPVTVDGAVGPKTAAAVMRAHKKAGDYLVDAYGIARRDYYFAIADKRRASRKYARTRAGGKGGWIKRAEEFISPSFHMTDSAFQNRVARWK
ncbi:holin-associated N-acetylmuramidase [Epibacterium ulvae]|uniref:holin-associated N-acetylmuramidase n=1 Tax=Epibacterium ulvae TaxID=1156985 RepID=UPI002492B850|nr:holin-associated N-acetylmuramidase [Epibacterium ulvae]